MGIIREHAQTGSDGGLCDQVATRCKQGFAPPREIYLVQNRGSVDWSQLPDWARPTDPDCFEGCCHGG